MDIYKIICIFKVLYIRLHQIIIFFILSKDTYTEKMFYGMEIKGNIIKKLLQNLLLPQWGEISKKW